MNPICKSHLMTPMAVAGMIFMSMMVTSAGAEEMWKSNDFEDGHVWFTAGKGAELTTDEAYSGEHSLLLPANDGLHIYQPFAEMPTLKAGQSFGRFVFHLMVFVFDNTGTSQTFQQGVRFSTPDNKSESSWVTSRYNPIHPGWNELSFDFTKAANANYAAGRTKLSQASIRAFIDKKGSYSPYHTYYIDDASFTYTIVPDPEKDQAP